MTVDHSYLKHPHKSKFERKTGRWYLPLRQRNTATHRRGGYYPIDGNLRDKKSEEGKGVEGRNIKRNLRKQSAK